MSRTIPTQVKTSFLTWRCWFFICIFCFSHSCLRPQAFSVSSPTDNEKAYKSPTSFPAPSSDDNVVSVSITKRIPNISPSETREAWLKYTWEKGGGLPILVLSGNGKHEDEDCDNDDEKDSGKASIPSSRTLLPLFAKEILVDNEKKTKTDSSRAIIQCYKLTALGLWQTEIEQDSHLGTVSFSDYAAPGSDDKNNKDVTEMSNMGTELMWNVTFTTLNRQNLWQTVTEQTISDACDNLASYLAEPILFTKRMTITVPDREEDSSSTNSGSATTNPTLTLSNKWIEFIWRRGGGLPLPLPPLSLSKDGFDRMIIPPFLREKILRTSTNDIDENSEIIYTVVNPSLLTYPVHTHLGRIRFLKLKTIENDDEDSSNKIEMCWEVNIRPFRNCESFVKTFTETVVTTLATNFKTHVEQPGEMVGVRAPRGVTKESLFQIRKDSWLGSVLQAHLNDNRSTSEQMMQLFQPTTWGMKYDDSCLESSWTTADISSDVNSAER